MNLRDAFLAGLNDALEKTAAAKWREELRRAYGTPEYPAMRRKLIHAGILDPHAEKAKLGRAAEVIAQKHNVGFLHPEDMMPERHMLDRIPIVGKRLSRGYTAAGKKAFRQKTGGAAYIPAFKTIVTEPGTGRVTKAHEAYEVVAHESGKKRNKAGTPVRESLKRIKDRIMWGRGYNFRSTGHLSPTVLMRESQAIPFLPARDQLHFENMRRRSGEKKLFKMTGERYGSTTKVKKTAVNRMERTITHRPSGGIMSFVRSPAGKALRKVLTRGKK